MRFSSAARAALPPGKTVYHLGQAHIVQHAYEVDIPTARVVKSIYKKASRVDIVDPHTAATPATFVHNALHRTARNKKFLKHAAVELGKRIAPGNVGDMLRSIKTIFCRLCTITPHYSLHKLTNKIVRQRLGSAFKQKPVFAHPPSRAVGYKVAPLVAISIALVALTPFAQ